MDKTKVESMLRELPELPILYKTDSKDGIRTWKLEINEEGNKYRTHSGVLGGKQSVSTYKDCESKNVGKSNETTDVQQCTNEVTAGYTKKLGKHYFLSEEEAKSNEKFMPMLAEVWAEYKDKVEYPVGVQPKLDGMRCVTPKGVLTSRGNKLINSVPHIKEALDDRYNEGDEAIIDGELYNHDLCDDFGEIMSILRKKDPTPAQLESSRQIAQYHIYDIDLPMGYLDRYEEMKNRFKWYDFGDTYTPLILVPMEIANNEDDVKRAMEKFLDLGYEGAIIRELNTPYEQKRSKQLLKLKEFEDGEFEIVSVESGVGNWAGCAKRVKFKLPEDWYYEPARFTVVGAGIKGKKAAMKKLLKEADQLVGTQVKIRYGKPSPDGIPRWPVAVDFFRGKRED